MDALTLILKGYIAIGKLQKGDEVMVPANTFIATILSVIHAGLKPIFIEPHPNALSTGKASLLHRANHLVC